MSERRVVTLTAAATFALVCMVVGGLWWTLGKTAQ